MMFARHEIFLADRVRRRIPQGGPTRIHGLSFEESPSAMQNLGAGLIEAHRINPALHDRQTICRYTVAAAEPERVTIVPQPNRGITILDLA
jgi:hypothetical protein